SSRLPSVAATVDGGAVSPSWTTLTGGSCFLPAITTPPQLRRRLGRVRPPEVKSFMARNAARSVAVHVCAVGDAREHATGHDQLVRVIMGIGPLKRPPAAVDAGVRLRVAPISAHALMRRSVPGVQPPMRPPVAASNLRAPVQ